MSTHPKLKPDPKGWISTKPRTFVNSFNLATPPPSTDKRVKPILPTAGPSSSSSKARQVVLPFAPTPPDSRSRTTPSASGAAKVRGRDAASPSMGRQRPATSQRAKPKSTLRTTQSRAISDDELDPAQASTPRQRPTLAPKDPNILLSPHTRQSYKSTVDFSSEPERDVTPARPSVIEACAALVPGHVSAQAKSKWDERALWRTNPLPSPGVRRKAPSPAPDPPRKRRRLPEPEPISKPTKLPRTVSLLERSGSESIDAKELQNWDFDKEVATRVFRKVPAPIAREPEPLKKIKRTLGRHHTSPASLGSDPPSDSSMNPLSSSDPPEPAPEPETEAEPVFQLPSPKVQSRPSPGRTPSPIVPKLERSSSSPRRFHEYQQTLFSQYRESTPPRRHDFVPAQFEPETLMTWSAASSSDSDALPLLPAVQVVGSLDRWLEDEEEVTRVNEESLAFREMVEREVEAQLPLGSPSDRSPTPCRHVKFAPTPLAREESESILVPDSQESYHPLQKNVKHESQSLNDFVPETMFQRAASSSPISQDLGELGESIVQSSQTQVPLFRGIDLALLQPTGAEAEADVDTTPRPAPPSKTIPRKKELPQPGLASFGFFALERKRKARTLDRDFEDEAELSEDEAQEQEQEVISSQTQMPLFPAPPMHPGLREAGRREMQKREAERRARRQAEVEEREQEQAQVAAKERLWREASEELDVDVDDTATIPSSQAGGEDPVDGVEATEAEAQQSQERSPRLRSWLEGLPLRRIDAFDIS